MQFVQIWSQLMSRCMKGAACSLVVTERLQTTTAQAQCYGRGDVAIRPLMHPRDWSIRHAITFLFIRLRRFSFSVTARLLQNDLRYTHYTCDRNDTTNCSWQNDIGGILASLLIRSPYYIILRSPKYFREVIVLFYDLSKSRMLLETHS